MAASRPDYTGARDRGTLADCRRPREPRETAPPLYTTWQDRYSWLHQTGDARGPVRQVLYDPPGRHIRTAVDRPTGAGDQAARRKLMLLH